MIAQMRRSASPLIFIDLKFMRKTFFSYLSEHLWKHIPKRFLERLAQTLTLTPYRNGFGALQAALADIAAVSNAAAPPTTAAPAIA
jgi:hypothetical protein